MFVASVFEVREPACLGFVLGLIASKIVSNTGEGTVVELRCKPPLSSSEFGAVIGGWFPSYLVTAV